MAEFGIIDRGRTRMKRLSIKRISVWMALAVVLTLTCAAVVILAYLREPVYQGHPLSYWVDQLPARTMFFGNASLANSYHYANSFGTAPGGRDRFAEMYERAEMTKKASQAVDHIGEKGLPCLIARLRHRDPAFEIKFIQWATRRGWIKPSIMRGAEFRSEQAATALLMLGDRARGAVPALRVLATDKNPSVRVQARNVLSEIAPQEPKTPH